MKRYPSGLIVFDKIDVMLISFSVGSGLAFLISKYKIYYNNKKQDPIVIELKKSSPLRMVSESGEQIKVPVIRGGQNVRGRILTLLIENKKLAILMRAILNARTKQKHLRLLQFCFLIINSLLTSTIGVRFAVGGSFNTTQFILLVLPSTVSGLITGLLASNPLAVFLFPLSILYGRGIEDVIAPSEKCSTICKVAADFHNKELKLEMEQLNRMAKKVSTQTEESSLVCIEEKLSLTQRYKLKEMASSNRTKARVQYFSEFIKKFPECNPDPTQVYQQIVDKLEK
jgi:hypothetical protein